MKRNIDLSANILGLEKTLEDDILDIMEEYVKDTANNIISGVIDDSKKNTARNELNAYIRQVVYEVLTDLFNGDINVGGKGRSFTNQLIEWLEIHGFEKDCRSCYYQIKTYGKMPHGKL